MRSVTKRSEQLARERLIAAGTTPPNCPNCPNCGEAEAHWIPDHLDKYGTQVAGHFTCADENEAPGAVALFDLDGGVA